tara:strand:- start:274 stop:573 length:300 start_codon:yes stop_codon:yes gene_type:complete
MEIDRLLKLEDTDQGKIEMIISNNLDLMYKGKACVTIDNWDKLTNEILAWRKHENEKLFIPDVMHLLTEYEKFASGENYINSKQLIDKQIKEFIEVNCA